MRGLSFDAGAAMLAPVQPKRAAPNVQRDEPAAAPSADEELRGRFVAANALLNSGDHAGARDAYLRIYNDPRFPGLARGHYSVRYNLAYAYHALGDHESAVSFATEAANQPKSDRASCASLIRLARLHTQEQTGQGSSEADLKARFDAGVAQIRGGDWAGALSTFEGVYADPGLQTAVRGHYSTRYNIGVSLAQLGRHAEAISMFQEVLSRGDVVQAHRQTCFDAIRESELALAGPPSGASGTRGSTEAQLKARFLSAVAAMQAGDFAGALSTLMGVFGDPGYTQTSRGHISTTYNIALCHHELGNRAEALRWAQTVLVRRDVDASMQLKTRELLQAIRTPPAPAATTTQRSASGDAPASAPTVAADPETFAPEAPEAAAGAEAPGAGARALPFPEQATTTPSASSGADELASLPTASEFA